MSQWKKLLFDHDVSDMEGDIWRFNYKKTAFIIAIVLCLFIVAFGFLASKDSHKFFSDIIFYGSILLFAVFALLLLAGSIARARKFIGKFLIIFVCMIGAYGLVGFVWGEFLWNFYMGYSTWLLLTVMAGYGATRDYIFNGKLDRHDIFYILLVFFVFVSANMPIVQGSGFLERLDDMISFIIDNLGRIGSISQRVNDTINQTTP